MSDVYIISKMRRFNSLLKSRVENVQNLVNSIETFDDLSMKEASLIMSKRNTILLVDGSFIHNSTYVENILKLSATSSIIIIKNIYNHSEVYHFLKAGVKGLTSLENCYTNIIAIINAMKRDEIYLSSNEVGHLFQHIKSSLDTSELTGREQQILPLIMNGQTYYEVADELNISYETIKSHMKNIYRKLNVRTKYDLLRYNLSNEL